MTFTVSNSNWEEFRGDCLQYTREEQENALKKYLNEIEIHDTFAYNYSYSENKMVIYTSIPGVWIGKGGVGVKRLKEILSTKIMEGCEVEFQEIRGKFVSV